MPKIQRDVPINLKPYLFHGLSLNWVDGTKEASGDCPWCGREGRFNVNIQSGLWRCLICNSSGNVLTFIRNLHETALRTTDNLALSRLSQERRFLSPESLAQWGVCVSPLTKDWIVPGYDCGGKVKQLYRYMVIGTRKCLVPIANLSHGIHGMNLYYKDAETIYLCEGIWDGIALWEVLGRVRKSKDKFIPTSNRDFSLLTTCSVLATPSCTVFSDTWTSLFSDKNVFLLYDNDHPRVNPNTQETIPPASLSGMQRVSQILYKSKAPPRSVGYLRWAEKGWDASLPSGYDVRDILSI